MENDYYVYVYSHPDTRQPFYVGKGRGGRALAHLDFEEAENEKQKIIEALRRQGRKPIIEIIQWGMSEDAAFAAEAALIQHIGLDQISNKVRGRGGNKLHADFIEYIRRKTPLQRSVRQGEEMLVLSANRFYRNGMSRFELYDAVRGNLKVSESRVKACRVVLVVLWRYVIDVYLNPECVEAGTEARMFEQDDDAEDEGFDLVAGFADVDYRNRFVGRALDSHFGFARFTYEKIRLPHGRW